MSTFFATRPGFLEPSAPPMPSAPPPPINPDYRDNISYSFTDFSTPPPPTNPYLSMDHGSSLYPDLPDKSSLSKKISETVNYLIDNYSPFNFWEASGKSRFEPDRPLFVTDQSNGDKYYYKKTKELRSDQMKLLSTNLLPRTVRTLAYIGIKALKTVTFFEILIETTSERVTLKERVIKYGKDVLSIPASLVHFALINLASLYGLVRPNDGRKLYYKLNELSPQTGIKLLDTLEYKIDHFVPLNRK